MRTLDEDDDAGTIARLLSRIAARVRLQQTLIALAVLGLCSAAGRVFAQTAPGIACGAAAAAILLWRGRHVRTAAVAAARLERANSRCGNLVITAEELLRHPDRAPAWVRGRVFADAVGAVARTSLDGVVPLSRPAGAFVLSAIVAVAAFTAAGGSISHSLRAGLASAARAGSVAASAPMQIVVTVTPPSYTRRPPVRTLNPERVEAIQGSGLTFAISGGNSQWRVRTAGGVLSSRQSSGDTIVDLTASESGYIAIEPLDAPGRSDGRRLIPLLVTPDRAPNVQVDAPGRDLVFPAARGTVPVAASASDDLGLATLEIRYTKVSGSGEQFSFEEGSLAISIARSSDTAWRATGSIPLAALKLAPGDAVVYRAVARDKRTGDAGLASSDSFFIEIAGADQVALDGFEMPPDQNRYALSQQMIVLKIQRLRAREPTMAAAARADAAGSIAAEQRAVRANFIFLLGGHVEEVEHDTESAEDQDGRLQNSARQDINAAIAHMTRAEQSLVAVDTSSALAAAKAAVGALQRAFGRNRYILRTIPTGSRIDPSRRLTGEIAEAGDWRRNPDAASVDRETREARDLLARLLDAAAALQAGRTIEPTTFTALAERALAINPDASVWQEVAAKLQRIQTETPTGMFARLSEAVAPVLARARRDARMKAGPATRSPAGLRGAWAAEFERAAGR